MCIVYLKSLWRHETPHKLDQLLIKDELYDMKTTLAQYMSEE